MAVKQTEVDDRHPPGRTQFWHPESLVISGSVKLEFSGIQPELAHAQPDGTITYSS
jgi:hypothetical protein